MIFKLSIKGQTLFVRLYVFLKPAHKFVYILIFNRCCPVRIFTIPDTALFYKGFIILRPAGACFFIYDLLL